MKTIPARNRGKAQEAAKALVHGCSGRCAPFPEECDLRGLFLGVFVRMEKMFSYIWGGHGVAYVFSEYDRKIQTALKIVADLSCLQIFPNGLKSSYEWSGSRGPGAFHYTAACKGRVTDGYII